jgi:hypothetical protein
VTARDFTPAEAPPAQLSVGAIRSGLLRSGHELGGGRALRPPSRLHRPKRPNQWELHGRSRTSDPTPIDLRHIRAVRNRSWRTTPRILRRPSIHPGVPFSRRGDSHGSWDSISKFEMAPSGDLIRRPQDSCRVSTCTRVCPSQSAAKFLHFANPR